MEMGSKEWRDTVYLPPCENFIGMVSLTTSKASSPELNPSTMASLIREGSCFSRYRDYPTAVGGRNL